MSEPRRRWSEEDMLLAFRLYCHSPFGRLHRSNPEIIELAKRIGRTPSSVSMKACNFASLDPMHKARGVKGLKNVSRADRELWSRFANDSESVAAQAEAVWENIRINDEDADATENHISERDTEKEVLVKARRVQGFFRKAVLTSYECRCAVTGIANPSLLNASHIIPWSIAANRRADPTNGICLNALHDRAFDRGLITFDADLRVVVSPLLKEASPSEFHKRAFETVAGRRLSLPTRFLPDSEALAYHRKHVFRES